MLSTALRCPAAGAWQSPHRFVHVPGLFSAVWLCNSKQEGDERLQVVVANQSFVRASAQTERAPRNSAAPQIPVSVVPCAGGGFKRCPRASPLCLREPGSTLSIPLPSRQRGSNLPRCACGGCCWDDSEMMGPGTLTVTSCLNCAGLFEAAEPAGKEKLNPAQWPSYSPTRPCLGTANTFGGG